jgi:murein DD-endopeptidase MepM/ murein hydrolase activator NlpD
MRNLVLYLFVLFNSCNAQEPTQEVSSGKPKQSRQATSATIDPKDYPKGYFRNPLAIPLQLSANFGELRTNHFHMGFDIRTAQRENLPVFAAAEGYVSRVKIEPGGFGQAIYLTHPNGYTTLYAHLNSFYPQLSEYIENKQYESQQWQQEIEFEPNQFRVAKGEVIANSGNTGASAGPHLHFEIRNTETENNLNPWLFNLGLTDNIPPSVYRLYFYDRRYSTYQVAPTPIPIRGSNGNYTRDGVLVVPTPTISFGIAAEDKYNISAFRYGIYAAELWWDDTLQSSFRLDDISYNETRYSNASIDYTTKLSGGAYIQHLSRLPGNASTIFTTLHTDGLITLTDTAVHDAKILVKDAAGNTSIVTFKVRFDPAKVDDRVFAANSINMSPGRENTLTEEEVEVVFPPKAFYDMVPFVYKAEEPKDTKVVSKIHHLHNYKVPVHDYYSVRVKPAVPLTEEAKEKVVMQLVSNRKIVTMKGKWNNDWKEGSFRDLGYIRLLIDSTPPAVNSSWRNGANLSKAASITIYTRDNTEVESFNAMLDGQWLLFSRKGNSFIHKFDERTSAGTHNLTVTVEDVPGNVTEKTFAFTR